MRAVSLLTVLFVIDLSGVNADLRLAAWPRVLEDPKSTTGNTKETRMESRMVVHQGRRRALPFNASYALYYEPSDFGYEDLKKQRSKNYDNFLRSNIDNEQDRRNIDTEDGRDHLPFRTWEGCKDSPGKHCDVQASHDWKMMNKDANKVYGEHSMVHEYGEGIKVRGKIATSPPEADNVLYPACLQLCKDDNTCKCFNWDPKDGTKSRCYLGSECRGKHKNPNANQKNVEKGVNVRHHLPYLQVAPGVEQLVPLRWNNPHSAELEVNVWIMNTGQANPIVVPVMKPSCSGEGRQDQAFTFKIPPDFNNLGTKVAGFNGCKVVGDCVLQIYAHSVEPRQYAIGVPLVVTGVVTLPAVGVNTNQVKIAAHVDLKDPGVIGVDDATRSKLCRPRGDQSVHWTTSNPQEARLVSDQWNWAYQNSDYSPYAGQQPKMISRNLQAAVVIEMIPGNRGTFGIHALYRDNREGFNLQRKVLKRARKVRRKFEETADAIIQFLEKKPDFMNTDIMSNIKNTLGETVEQKTETCFRCKETGSVGIKRKNTATYIPSFQIPAGPMLDAVKLLIAKPYQREAVQPLVDDEGYVQIYYAAMWKLMPRFRELAAVNIHYQGAVIKESLDTKPDARNYKRIDKYGVASGGTRRRSKDGLSAKVARLAYIEAKRFGNKWCEEDCLPADPLPATPDKAAETAALALDCPIDDQTCSVPTGLATGATDTIAGYVKSAETTNSHSLDADADCDDISYCSSDECDGANDKDVSEMTCQPSSTIKHQWNYTDVGENLEAADAANSVGVVAALAANPFSTSVVTCMLIFCATLF